MRIAIIGAGGVGGWYGARLIQAGETVIFLARGAHLEALQTHGLTLQTKMHTHVIPVHATNDPASIGPVDLVLMCVKTYDAAASTASLTPLVAPETLVLTVQNGLDTIEVIKPSVGPGHLLAGVVQQLAVQRVAPGVILHTGGEGTIIFGVPDEDPNEGARRVSDVFARAGIPHELSSAMPGVLWEKFLFIAGVGSVTALARAPIGPLLADPEGRLLLTTACTEIVTLARAEGIDLGADAVERALQIAATFSPDWKSSLARDVEMGNRLEVEALSGTVVRRARTHGLSCASASGDLHLPLPPAARSSDQSSLVWLPHPRPIWSAGMNEARSACTMFHQRLAEERFIQPKGHVPC